MIDRLQVIDGGKHEAPSAIRGETSRTPHHARRAQHAARVAKLRQLAEKVRALGCEVESETQLDAMKLRGFAIHLENVAEMVEQGSA